MYMEKKITNKSDSGVDLQAQVMGPQLVPEQHTVVSNIKFLMPGLASKFYFSHSKLMMSNYYALVMAINILILIGLVKICLPSLACHPFPPPTLLTGTPTPKDVLRYWAYNNIWLLP